MNFELFGLILSWVGLCWSLLVIVGTIYTYVKYLRNTAATIELNREFLILTVSSAYMYCYYIK